MEVQAVGILLCSTWLSGSENLNEDVMQLAFYLEEARWVTAGGVTVGRPWTHFLSVNDSVPLWSMAGGELGLVSHCRIILHEQLSFERLLF